MATRSSPRKQPIESIEQEHVIEEILEEDVRPKEESLSPAKRGPGRPRKAIVPASTEEIIESPNEGRRTRRSRAYEFPEDSYSAAHGGYRCFVPGCPWISETRAARSFHLRQDHPETRDSDLIVGSISRCEMGSPQRIVEVKTENVIMEDDEEIEVAEELIVDEHGMQLQPEQHRQMQDIESDFEEGDPGYDRSSPEPEEVEIVQRRRQAAPLMDEEGRIIKRGRGRPRKGPFDPPGPHSRLRIPDPQGRYPCYAEGCNWKGRYRSVRSAHMRAMHRDWVRPPSFTLARVTRHGQIINPNVMGELPKYGCPVVGCPWRGNFKASRLSHMRRHHSEIPVEMPARRVNTGGYVEDGKYACHVPECDWRGASRSTRSTHMKREHENFINTIYSARNVPCCDCPASLQSHKLFVDHMVCEHNVGGIVQREFTDPRDYEEWFDAVQESFSIDFIKRMGVKQTSQYQVLYLYCARGGGYRDPRLHRYNKNAINPVRVPLNQRNRNTRGIQKCGKNCAAFLRVLNWVDGRLTVIGCVEHTGHRMGTQLLRLSQMEREVMDEYLYSINPNTPLDIILDMLRDHEGYKVDGYEVLEKTEEDVRRYIKNEEDEMESLLELLKSPSLEGCTFAVNLPDCPPTEPGDQSRSFTLGIMSPVQEELWKNHSKKASCIEEVRLVLGNWDVHVFIVIIFDEQDTPKCVAVYLSHSKDKLPLLAHLKNVCSSPPETLVNDGSPEYEELLETVYGPMGFQVDAQVSEWHLLSEWATLCDQLVVNRVDRFAIICALRRWVRASDPVLFEAMVAELFDALREMEQDELANYLDGQLTDPNFAKRWTPLNRNPLTDHNNPLLEIACRMLRERFLSCEICKRMDEYIGLLADRVTEFNNCNIGQVYTTSVPEPPRAIPHDWEDDPRYLGLSQHMLMEADLMGVRKKEIDEDQMVEMVEEVMDSEVFQEEIVVEEHDIARAMVGMGRMQGGLNRGQESHSREVGRMPGGMDVDEEGMGLSPRRQKLVQMFKRRMEEANEDELEIFESNMSHQLPHKDKEDEGEGGEEVLEEEVIQEGEEDVIHEGEDMGEEEVIVNAEDEEQNRGDLSEMIETTEEVVTSQEL